MNLQDYFYGDVNLGKACYEAYCKNMYRLEKTVCPGWVRLSDNEKIAWIEAAVEASRIHVAACLI